MKDCSGEVKLYGNLESEKLAKDSTTAREIVKEIGDFEINDRQRWLILYYLSLELENVDEMKAMTSYIKEVKGSSLFITSLYGGGDGD
jgi:hypothetical protein